MTPDGNNFNYFPESLILFLTKKLCLAIWGLGPLCLRHCSCNSPSCLRNASVVSIYYSLSSPLLAACCHGRRLLTMLPLVTNYVRVSVRLYDMMRLRCTLS